MRIESQFNQQSNIPTLTSVLNSVNNKNALDLMCCRVGIVQTFYPDDLTADILIVNKKTIGLNQNGSQVARDWASVRAKVCYCSPYETFPINQGDECLLFFSDREIESWFINGNTNPIAHQRMHDETDCIAVFGLRSLPKMIQILTDALHLFFGNSDIQLKENDIISNTPNFTLNAKTQTDINTQTLNINGKTINLSGTNINIEGTLTINGQPYLEHTHKGNLGSPTSGVII